MLKRKKAAERDILDAMTPPFHVARPNNWQGGIVFASPHSGNIYPKALLKRSQLSLLELRKNEDVFIDRLFAPAVEYGAPLLTARFPRCFVDVNRAPEELPSAQLTTGTRTTPRAELGLGVVPSIISQGRPIYKTAPSRAATDARLEALYFPYHNELSALLSEAKRHRGHALLIDCHSMPAFSLTGDKRPDVILGDRYGQSCHPETLARIEAIFQAVGLNVVRNHPYAGGYVTSHYGQPDIGIEAVQIELNRDLYLNPITLNPNKNYSRFEAIIERIIRDIIAGFEQDDALAAQ